jgi:hypothetical protein
MGRPAGQRITTDIAHEVCVRECLKATKKLPTKSARFRAGVSAQSAAGGLEKVQTETRSTLDRLKSHRASGHGLFMECDGLGGRHDPRASRIFESEPQEPLRSPHGRVVALTCHR